MVIYSALTTELRADGGLNSAVRQDSLRSKPSFWLGARESFLIDKIRIFLYIQLAFPSAVPTLVGVIHHKRA